MLLTLLGLYVGLIAIVAIKLMVKIYLQLNIEQKKKKTQKVLLILTIISMFFLLIFLFFEIIQLIDKGGC